MIEIALTLGAADEVQGEPVGDLRANRATHNQATKGGRQIGAQLYGVLCRLDKIRPRLFPLL